MTIYEVLKRVIGRGGYDAADIRRKASLYHLYGVISDEEYTEIMTVMNA